MPNPRNYPDVITSAESGRPLYRGVKRRKMTFEGKSIEYDQPGWWASLDDPDDMEGQFVDEDNLAWTRAIKQLRESS